MKSKHGIPFINPSTGNRWKKGEMHIPTGRVFNSYHWQEGGRMGWFKDITAYKSDKDRIRASCEQRRRRDGVPIKTIEAPRINPQTGARWKKGDTDLTTGRVFDRWSSRYSTGMGWYSSIRVYRKRIDEVLRWYASVMSTPEGRSRLNEKSKAAQIRFGKSGNRGRYIKRRRENDPMFAMKRRVRDRLKNFIKSSGLRKNASTEAMIGCSWSELRCYIEHKFSGGMNWSNRRFWQIDHIVPLSSARTEKELIELFHYTNLQPLWAADNMRKGAKMAA